MAFSLRRWLGTLKELKWRQDYNENMKDIEDKINELEANNSLLLNEGATSTTPKSIKLPPGEYELLARTQNFEGSVNSTALFYIRVTATGLFIDAVKDSSWISVSKSGSPADTITITPSAYAWWVALRKW